MTNILDIAVVAEARELWGTQADAMFAITGTTTQAVALMCLYTNYVAFDDADPKRARERLEHDTGASPEDVEAASKAFENKCMNALSKPACLEQLRGAGLVFGKKLGRRGCAAVVQCVLDRQSVAHCNFMMDMGR